MNTKRGDIAPFNLILNTMNEDVKVTVIEEGQFAGTVITEGEGFTMVQYNEQDPDNPEPFEMVPYPFRP